MFLIRSSLATSDPQVERTTVGPSGSLNSHHRHALELVQQHNPASVWIASAAVKSWTEIGLVRNVWAAEIRSQPHGGVRPFHQKSTCLTRLTLGPNVVQIWSRYPSNQGSRHQIRGFGPYFTNSVLHQVVADPGMVRTWQRKHPTESAGPRVQGPSRVQSPGSKVYRSVFRVLGSGLRVQDSRFGGRGSGFKV